MNPSVNAAKSTLNELVQSRRSNGSTNITENYTQAGPSNLPVFTCRLFLRSDDDYFPASADASAQGASKQAAMHLAYYALLQRINSHRLSCGLRDLVKMAPAPGISPVNGPKVAMVGQMKAEDINQALFVETCKGPEGISHRLEKVKKLTSILRGSDSVKHNPTLKLILQCYAEASGLGALLEDSVKKPSLDKMASMVDKANNGPFLTSDKIRTDFSKGRVFDLPAPVLETSLKINSLSPQELLLARAELKRLANLNGGVFNVAIHGPILREFVHNMQHPTPIEDEFVIFPEVQVPSVTPKPVLPDLKIPEAKSWKAILEQAQKKPEPKNRYDFTEEDSLSPMETDIDEQTAKILLLIGNVEAHPGPQMKGKTASRAVNAVRREGKKEIRALKKEATKEIKRVEKKIIRKPLPARRVTSKDVVLAKASHKRALSNISSQLPSSMAITQDMNTSKMNQTQRVLWSLCAPRECAPVRFCDEYACVETSLANPYSVEVAPWNASGASTTVPWLSNNDLFMTIHRNAERGSIIGMNNPGAYEYLLYGKNLDTTTALVPSTDFTQKCDVGPSVSVPIPIAYAWCNSTNGPHTTIMFCGTPDGLQSDPRRFLLFNAGDNFTIRGDWGTSQTINVGLDLYTPQGIVHNQYVATSVTGTGGTFTIPVTQTGYYSPSVISGGALSDFTIAWSNGKFSNSTATFVFAQRPIAGFDLNWNVATAIRVPSASVLYTNKAAEMYRNGFFTFLQPPKGSHWTDFVANQFIPGSGLSIKNVMGNRTAVDGSINNGTYAFLKPTQDEDFEARVYSQVIGGRLYDSFYPLNDKSEFMLLWLNIPYQSGAPTAQDGLITIAHGVEFEPLDTWRTRKIGTISQNHYKTAIAHLRDIPQVHENPGHLSDLWNGIMSGVKWVWNNGAKTLAQKAVSNAFAAPIKTYRGIQHFMKTGEGGMDLAEALLV